MVSRTAIALTCWALGMGSLVIGQELPLTGDIPRHGYVKSLEMERFRHLGGVPAGVDFAPANDPVPIERAVPVVMIRFNGIAPPYAVDVLQDQLFDTDDPRWKPTTISPPTLRRFFWDMSSGKWSVSGRCYGWYLLGALEEYQNNDPDEYWLKIYSLIWRALERADIDVDFSRYDTDNVGPKSDSVPDGFVDTVFIVHPFVAAQADAASSSRYFTHHSSLTEIGDYLEKRGKTLPGKYPFTTNDVRRDVYGNRLSDRSELVKIDDYCFLPAIHKTPTMAVDPTIPMGTFCHEYGHMLGLPDLYSRTQESDDVDKWCLMCKGEEGHDGASPLFPVPLSAWCRYRLGWSQPLSFNEAVSELLAPACESPKILKLPLPSRAAPWDRYFLVEVRAKAPAKSLWKVNWDQTLGKSFGAALWLVDESVGRESKTWPLTEPGKGQNDRKDLPLVSFLTFMSKKGDSMERDGIKLSLDSLDDSQAKFSATPHAPPLSVSPPKIAGIDVGPVAPIEAVSVKESPMTSLGERVALAKQFGQAILNEDELKALLELPSHQYPNNLSAKVLSKLVDESRITRTIDLAKPLPEWAGGAPKIEKDWEDYKRKATARLAAGGKTFEFIQGLDKPLKGINLKSGKLEQADVPDPQTFAEKILPYSSDSSIVLQPDKKKPIKETDGGYILNFHQAVKHGNQELPLFGCESQVFVNNAEAVTSASFNTMPASSLIINGRFGTRTETEVAAKAAHTLQIDPSRVNVCTRGVGLVDKDPTKGRVGYELCVSAGEGRTPIKVFVDGETERILYVRSE